MKKIFSALLIFVLALTVVGCKKKEDPAVAILDEAIENLQGVINDPSSIVASFNVPTKLANDVTASWVSGNTDHIQVGQANEQGLVIITVIRPEFGASEVVVNLTVTVSVKSEKTGEMVEKPYTFKLTVKPETVEKLEINNIKDILNIKDDKYDPKDEKDKVSVALKNVTVIAVGSDASFIYDGTGTTMVYGGDASKMKVGSVYNVNGLLEWYFGMWEIIKPTFEEVSGQTPKYPEKQVVTSIDAYIAELVEAKEHHAAFGSAKDGNFEPVLANITAKVFMIDKDTSNYNTFLIDKTKDTLIPGKAAENAGDPSTPASGLMAYYPTNDFAYLRSFNGFEVNLDVVVHTYRSNNNAFAFYYVGGKDGIELGELTDEQAVELDVKGISLPTYIFEDTTLKTFVAEGKQGSTFEWTVDKPAIINLETGKVDATAANEPVKVTLKATKGEATQTKTYTINVGTLEVVEIDKLLKGNNGQAFRIEGVVTSFGPYNSFTVEDASGAAAFRISGLNATSEELTFKVGDTINAIVTKAVFNGLVQGELFGGKASIGKVKVTENATLPAAVSLQTEALTKENLLKFQSKLVNLNNMLVVKHEVDQYDNVVMTLLRQDGQEIEFKWDSRLAVKDNTLATLKVNDVINIVGAPLTWNNGPVIMYDNIAQVVKAEALTDEAKLAFDVAKFEPTTDYAVVGDLKLPAKGLLFESAITYTFKNTDDTNNTLVDLATMKILSVPTEGQVNVTLIATIKLGELTEVREVKLLVGKAGNVVTFHETFETAELSTNPSVYNDVTFTGLNGVVWNFVHSMSSNVNDSANGILESGQGIILRRSNDPSPSSITATFANGLVDFSFDYRKAFTGGTSRKYSVDITNNGETTTIVIPEFGAGSGDQPQVYTFKSELLNLTGEVVIKIYATGADGNQQATFDNFKWTEKAPVTPAA
ncbi:immunoglobulin-like domain-containing protein [Haploplasma modicum]|uniref:immunoglobulin-like domain-containing protein n=1 Tax=Haploplasma modicum TaxID=2150 RepID=UPI00047D09FA|nr:immunoglobulin-like domain-containing protein [Haploplasma modicum]